MNILITGAAGFIGYHTTLKIHQKFKSIKIYGIDSINNYYSPKLKRDRIKNLKKKCNNKFIFYKLNIANKKKIYDLFKKHKFHTVVNLAAQAVVRHSLKNPDIYFETNLKGFYNIIEACKNFKVKHLISASTSSVYGDNHISKFDVNFATGHPTQFYAATKRSNELIGHAYSSLYNIPITFLRFFTVYGPWGRPDMALFLFVKNILKGKPINVYNHGNHSRDFTYVGDIVNAISNLIYKIPTGNKKWNAKSLNQSESLAPFKILNLGNGKKIKLMEFIREIENQLGKKAKINFMEFQKGDISSSLSKLSQTKKYINYKAKTNIKKGISLFISWYRKYYLI